MAQRRAWPGQEQASLGAPGMDGHKRSIDALREEPIFCPRESFRKSVVQTIRLTLLPSGPDVVHEAPLRKTQALRPDLKKDIKMAESERFELSIQVSPYTRFPGVLLQPLGQLSTMLYYQKLFNFVALPRDCRLQRYISYHPKHLLSTPFFLFSTKKSPQIVLRRLYAWITR